MSAQAGGGVASFFPLLLMLGIFYFLLIRPNQKREKAVKEMRSSLQIGDNVMTIGAIGGKIVAMDDTAVILETAPDQVKIRVQRWGIGRKVDEIEEVEDILVEEEAIIEEAVLLENELENEE